MNFVLSGKVVVRKPIVACLCGILTSLSPVTVFVFLALSLFRGFVNQRGNWSGRHGPLCLPDMGRSLGK